VLKKGSPGYLEPGQSTTPVRPFGLGTKGRVSDALHRFQNASDAPPPGAQNVAEKQEILRSSELSEFSTARTNLKPEQTTGTNTGECLRCRQVLVTAPGVHPAKARRIAAPQLKQS